MSNQTRILVAIPDSVVSDASTLREKTVKMGTIARALAIFQVERVYVYTDEGGRYSNDRTFIKYILEYIETPQYLRKRLFPRSRLLGFAGLLPPLRTPHHKLQTSPQTIRTGEYREGVTTVKGKQTFVDVGLPDLVPLDSKVEDGRRVTVVFTSQFPGLMCRLARKEETGEYWGYDVKTAPSLLRLILSEEAELLVLTSRKGRPLAEIWADFVKDLHHAGTVMLVFGSPKRGIFEILRDEESEPNSLSKYVINAIPNQGTATVRTEEALLATLSIINLSLQIQ